MMKKIEHFERELNLIANKELRSMITNFLMDYVPDYFWNIGASSSGKFHPSFSQGKGGLVRHTKAVVMFAEELLRMSSYSYMKDIYKDYIIAACIVHDTFKYGYEEFDKSEYRNHARNAARAIQDFYEMNGDVAPEMLTNAIASHMGQWSTDKEDRPFTSIDRCVHMADYMASRPFIHIPCIVEEWERVEGMVDEDELPFVF
jgi:hypothetical protein